MPPPRLAVLASVFGAVWALPDSVPLTLDKGFWYGTFSVGPQQFKLSIDTGSFVVLSSASSVQTYLSEFIRFNGASQDGIDSATGVISYVEDEEAAFAGVAVHTFLVGNITQGDPLSGDGIAGFSPTSGDLSDPFDPTFSPGQSILQAMCDQGDDTSKISGKVTTLPTQDVDAWQVIHKTEAGSPLLVIDGKPVTHVVPTFDSGTPNIIGPLSVVRQVLLSIGYNVTEQTNDGISVALGTYNCDREPARGSRRLNRTSDGKICTANVLETSTLEGGPYWQVGQTWFQGRYVQHDLERHTLSFADLA
ncbi:acid protease [Trametes elegans]|nr:acid protease [Trametes elegans]